MSTDSGIDFQDDYHTKGYHWLLGKRSTSAWFFAPRCSFSDDSRTPLSTKESFDRIRQWNSYFFLWRLLRWFFNIDDIAFHCHCLICRLLYEQNQPEPRGPSPMVPSNRNNAEQGLGEVVNDSKEIKALRALAREVKAIRNEVEALQRRGAHRDAKGAGLDQMMTNQPKTFSLFHPLGGSPFANEMNTPLLKTEQSDYGLGDDEPVDYEEGYPSGSGGPPSSY